MSGEVSCQVLRPSDLTSEHLDCWHRLQQSHESLASPFLSPTFAQSVERAGGDAYVCVLRAGEMPVAFLPFQYQNRWYRALGVAARIGLEGSDCFGLIAPSEFRINSATLLGLIGVTSLSFSHLDGAQLATGLQAEQPEPDLRIRLGGGDGGYWRDIQERDKRFVTDTERVTRRIAEDIGPLRFCWLAREPERTLSELITRKRQQYARTGAPDALRARWIRRLLELLADSQTASCAGILSTLHAGEVWIASHLGIRSERLLHYWFPVYNPELSRYSPGRLLLKALADHAENSGLETIALGAGEAQAKRKFANDERASYRGLWYRSGARSLAYRIGCSLRWRLDAIAGAAPVRPGQSR